ncbi:LAME_0G19020g1_1 [Lachancea meyersii CBS 8951]|uniref:LAME_0G19020g1_1 n=1 Tax=Lachancea meyersii CBS 8951 TaxID=1266667 RepID=A0A1G4KBZ3_9SACH|nr:LAME_0G19020g1_1 [Lachancea meyersii CBS 8951]
MVRTAKYRNSVAASVEIEIGPFGVSTINVKVGNSSVTGIGSCTARVNGQSWGLLYYNDEKDLSQKFKLYCEVRKNMSLRVDFIKLDMQTIDERLPPWKGTDPESPDYEVPELVFEGSRPGSSDSEVQPFVGVLAFEK